MKLNIEELAREAGFKSRNGFIRVQHSNGSFVVIDEELEDFARRIVERCAVTAQHANDWRGGHGEPGKLSGEELATVIRKLLEAE